MKCECIFVHSSDDSLSGFQYDTTLIRYFAKYCDINIDIVQIIRT